MKGLSLDELAFLKQHTDKPIKIPIPGPLHADPLQLV